MIKEITSEEYSKLDKFKNIFTSNIVDINNPFSKVIIYEEKGILGFAIYSIIYERCEIDFIGVELKYRRNSIGESLMDYIISSSKNEGCKSISLEVNINNIPAISLYKKKNFEIKSIRKNYYKNDDAYLMIKELGD